MKLRRAHIGIAVGPVLALGLMALPAQAATSHDTYPETPATNAQLPIVHTYHGSDHIKANILNPHPVCNSLEDYRTVIYKATDRFLPVGTISTTNQSSKPVPLTQTLSKSQSISLTVNGSQTESISVNTGGSGPVGKGTVNAGIAWSLAKSLGGSASYSLSWNVGQSIGPYEVPTGYTGEATYGFRVINLTGTQQYCKANGTWSNSTSWIALAPIKNEVKVKLYNTAAGSAESDAPNAITKPVDLADSLIPQPVEHPSNPEDGKAAHDLTAGFTVAAGKVPGFAGLVGIHVKNVGSERYFAEFPALRFRVDVKTAQGPKGVDRLITPGQFNGATVRDLGFNAKTSTRTFEVTLANPIKPGKDQLVGNLAFGDGLTSEGRIKNYITITQLTRVKGDNTSGNDQGIDSRQATLTDGGAKNAGLF